jgi:hypothetical protein
MFANLGRETKPDHENNTMRGCCCKLILDNIKRLQSVYVRL